MERPTPVLRCSAAAQCLRRSKRLTQKQKATNTLRQYVYGPGRMQPDAAIEIYKDRRVRDAQAPVGSTDFDELDASDSDAEDSDDEANEFSCIKCT